MLRITKITDYAFIPSTSTIPAMKKNALQLKHYVTFIRRPASVALLACLQFLVTPVCEGTEYTWTAADNNMLWDAQSAPAGGPATYNWSPGGVPGAGDAARFHDSAIANPHFTVDLNGNRAVQGITFEGPSQAITLGTSVGGDTLTIGNGNPDEFFLAINSEEADSTINCNVAMNDTGGDNIFRVMARESQLTINGVISGGNSLNFFGNNILGTTDGVLVLDNANTYTGGTIIESGGLRVSNASGSGTGTGPVTVEATALLSGTGRVGGAVTVDAGGTIAPGTSIGTLTALSGVTLNGTYACEIGGASADRLAVTGTLNVSNGTLDLTELNVPTGTSFTIATATTVQGTFATVEGLRPGLTLVYNSTSIVIERTPILHVDAAASPGGTGVSWGSALKTLDDALAYAISGDEIWVKEGVYVPGNGSGSPSSTFAVPDGIQLLGGFDGTETAANDRDPAAHLTVLSGDLDGNDTDKVDGITTSPANIVGTNAYSVVTVSFAAPVIDGFTITGGSALVTPISNPGGESRGGGVFIDTDFTRVPRLSNCRLYGNAAVQGGAIFVHSNGGCDIVSCDFRSNLASGRGGAAYYWLSNVTTTNCNFSGNYAGDDGGAIFDDPQATGTTLFVNCTITGNTAVDAGGAINASTTGSSSAEMFNTLIWNNSAGRASTINNVIFYDFFHCLLENINSSVIGASNLDGTNAGNDPGFFLPTDPALAPTMGGDFRPAPLSAVLNAGDNSAISGISLDLSGEPRILESTVDLGAYEGALYSSYDWWINSFFPGETDPAIIGPDTDPGGNGMNNALSFVTSTSPLSTDPVQPIELQVTSTTVVFSENEVRIGDDPFGGYMEYSVDLENWTRIPLTTPNGTEIEPGVILTKVEGILPNPVNPDPDLVILALSVDWAGFPKVFARMGVTTP